MTALVIGGSKSGKSGYAESLFRDFPGKRYYIASMEPHGPEAQAIIARHRLQRAGKGFVTVERPRDLAGLSLPPGCGALLEDLGNLCANEMFTPQGVQDPVPAVLRGIDLLRARCGLLVMVSNDIGCDSAAYPAQTQQYIRALGRIHAHAAAAADLVTECVFGIPVIRKGEAPCCAHC